MKKSIIFLFLVIGWPVVLLATNSNDSILKILDKSLDKAQEYADLKENRLISLKASLSKATEVRQKYDICQQLYDEYSSYKFDSAYYYAGKMLEYVRTIGNKNLLAESKIALSFSCLSAGLYKESWEISGTIDSTQLDKPYQASLYDFLSTLYINMSDFSLVYENYISYREKSLYYCRKYIKTQQPDSKNIKIARIRELQIQEKYPQAIRLCEQYLSNKNVDLHEYAIIASTLGYFYLTQKDTTQAIKNFASAAIADIKISTKETSAIRQLSEVLYLKGDIQKAYNYGMCALNDANFYNARQRKLEIGRILPIIEAGRFNIIEKQKKELLAFSIVVSILFVLVVFSTVMFYRQKKKLASTRLFILNQNEELKTSNHKLLKTEEEVRSQNITLRDINKKLIETHRIKDEYIGFFFSNNSSSLDKLDDYKKNVARKIRNRQFEELYQEATATDTRKEKEEMFSLFDQVFSKIFPDFVHQYNKLFKSEDQIEIKADGSLTPEIRIFALIRLGISESERIAKLLDFSLSTVKNYKTKAKNRSFVSNELFEQKIMEIGSVETEINE